jgi:steroid 5-alpha reductase family enzyme
MLNIIPIEIFNYLLVSVVFNLLLFIPAFIFKTDKLTDISYSLSFIFLGLIAFILKGDYGFYNILVTFMVLIWAIRLGSYLFIRINKMKRDKRFDGIRESFVKFGLFWFIQGISVWVVMIPALIFVLSERSVSSLYFLIAGSLIWLFGIIVESVADYQKSQFILNAKKEGKERHWVDIGLWKYSRHPNYLGEITLWLGIYIIAISRMDLFTAVVSFVGPLYIFIIIRYFSGVPKLEDKADERYGNREDYLKYKKDTGLLLFKLK